MVISSKGRYALRVMVDLAEHGGDGYVSMRDVARRQEISDKYAGQIMTLLSRAGLVDGVTGKGGGYRLTRRPEEYPLGEILRLTEGSLAPVACLEEGAHPCGRASRCRTLPVWNRLGQLIGDYLDSVTGRSLARPSAVVPARGPSSVSNTIVSFFFLTSTGTISSLNLPSALAFSHFCWLFAANSSSSSRVMPYFSQTFSAVMPM